MEHLIKMPAEEIKAILLQNTQNTILQNANTEFTELLQKLNGNEELQQIAQHLFEEGFRRLSSPSERVMKDLITVLSETFFDLVNSFKDDIGMEVDNSEESFGENITEQIGQMIRFVNFIKFLENIDPDGIQFKELILHLKEIKEFIFNNRKDWMPTYQDWAQSFKQMERDARNQKKGFETYYTSGLVEIIRTVYNKKRHRNAFPKSFVTEFNFYDDFHQIIGIYNLGVYSFIELIEAWVSINPFIDAHRSELV